MEIASNVAKGSTRLLQYAYSRIEGMTLKIDVTQGSLLVRGSFSIQNPTELTQDFTVMSNGNDIDYYISPELYEKSTTIDSGSQRRKRQTPIPTNATDLNVYLSIVGLDNNNTFILNTNIGDNTESITDGGKQIKLYIYAGMTVLLGTSAYN